MNTFTDYQSKTEAITINASAKSNGIEIKANEVILRNGKVEAVNNGQLTSSANNTTFSASKQSDKIIVNLYNFSGDIDAIALIKDFIAHIDAQQA